MAGHHSAVESSVQKNAIGHGVSTRMSQGTIRRAVFGFYWQRRAPAFSFAQVAPTTEEPPSGKRLVSAPFPVPE